MIIYFINVEADDNQKRNIQKTPSMKNDIKNKDPKEKSKVDKN